MTSADPIAVVAALDAAYTAVTDVVADLDDRQLLLPTGCHGWLVTDLLLHLTGDAQRALVALATPADGPPDVDAAGYWRGFPAGADDAAAAAHTQWLRRSAAAFERPSGVVQVWQDTAPAAVRAAAAADPTTMIRTQGLVLRVPDFLATLVVEAVVHHVDLITHLPRAAQPAPAALAVTASVLHDLAGSLPSSWQPREAVLKGSGREPLSDADRRLLGDRAGAFPLLG